MPNKSTSVITGCWLKAPPFVAGALTPVVSFIVAALPATGAIFSAVAAGAATPAWLMTTDCAPALFSFRFT
ncbi:hypothetical protein D3C76_1419330 [compost metagenome]